ncbi:BMP family lipoprotein [Salsipaludibacter albus]|uniref:BMP family lipoprotein n=1 Tax=Salsipaludibacter albus TaxID=2849650 RepID=UPI001EE4BB3F|nr:BMP family ABC transporter substrate-binding protein [Salsipaludibacter albus]MBY5161629.1 BMP family ABC transporter substrate-binding protein [Salsipaludibacter albus]
MRKHYRWGAMLAASALVITACGDAPEETSTEEETTAEATESAMPTESDMATESAMATESGSETATAAGDADYSACMVTDTGGVDDRSFNQTSYEGMQRAEEELGVSISVLESQSAADFEPNINEFIDQDCDLIVTVGFLLGEATAAAAEANPDQNFAIVDFDFFDAEAGEDITFDNVRELTFATDQAAFLAGYVAADQTETNAIGTYGGLNIPTVSIFMDGYLAGANYYNEQNDANVEVLGWDGAEGQFTGDFEDQTKGRNITEQLLQNGADIIMPVAGPVGQGTGAALRAAGTGKMIWVDTDGYESVAQFQDLILTSVMKNMNVAVYDTIAAGVDGSFEGGLYTGTLENEGVAIAPFHDFEGDVSEETLTALDEIRQGIIDGEIEVTSGG